MLTLIVATGNPGKLREMQAYLEPVDCQLVLNPTDLEIEEVGSTFMENACLKASQVAKALNQWAIADDSGLAVEALNGAPGLYSARYGRTDTERIQRLLTELGKETNRYAQFICAVAIAAPDGHIQLTSEGICPGEILRTPQGNNGFGYDPIFWVPGCQKTFAEMSDLQKKENSHRGKAFAKLLPQWPTLGG
ncbi:MAG: RdgB/HAM1 family non-canonical purine NTP pyrophosphatase [Synechocystis sp.]|jgi:XTP/dITP diphosphohydrolase